MRLALQFGTAVPIARMAHTILNLHWCSTPVRLRETNLAFQFQVYAKAGIPVPPGEANLALQFQANATAGTQVPPREPNLAFQFQAYAQTCTPIQEQCGTAAPRMQNT